MSKFRGIIDYLLYSNIYLAISASSVVYITLLILNLPIEPILLFIPFSEVLFIFNLNRITDIKEDEINVPKRLMFVKKHIKPLLALSVSLYAISLAVSYYRSLLLFAIVLAEGMLGAIYCIFRLKRFFLMKNLIVSVAWGSTVFVVAAYFNVFTNSILALFLIFFIAIFINNVLFDIKDIKGDKKYGILTIPHVYGVRKTVKMGLALNSILALFLLYTIFVGILPKSAILLFLFLGYIYAYLLMENRIKKEIYYGIFVDGEYVFIAVVYFVVMVYGKGFLF